jgi:hypothetical protein
MATPLIHDPAKVKLGKLAPVRLPHMRMFAELQKAVALPAPPPAVGWYKGTPATKYGPLPAVTSFDMDGNDTIGLCGVAGLAHFEQVVSTVAGSPVVPTKADCIAEYSRLTGYNPDDPSTDQGSVLSELLQAFETGGVFGRKISGFVGLDPTNLTQMKSGIWFFGATYLGVELPTVAQSQTVWDVTGSTTGDSEPGSWGGHCVLDVALDDTYHALVTWGSIKLATIAWIDAYCSEAYALLSPDWIMSKGPLAGLTPGGVPLASVAADLKRIAA